MAIQKVDVIKHENSTVMLPTTSKNGMLTFENDVSFRQRRTLISDDSVTLYWTPDGYQTDLGPIHIFNNKVGIGTTEASEMLDIVGNFKLSGSITGTHATALSLTTDTVQNSDNKSINISAADNLNRSRGAYIQLNGADCTDHGKLTLASGIWGTEGQIELIGNVGIGTTNPTYDLHIVGDMFLNSSNPFILDRTDAGYGPALELRENNMVHWTIQSSASGEGEGNLSFSNQSGLFDTLNLTQNGKVGIGTTSPLEKLDVYGNLRVSDSIGIGVQPEAWFTNWKALQVGGQLSMMSSSNEASTSNAWILYNTYYDGEFKAFAGNGGTSAIKVAYDSISFYITPIIDADTTFTPSEKMTILSNGNVGIGTANPSEKLYVSGSAIISSNCKVGIGNTSSIDDYGLNVSSTSYFGGDMKVNGDIISDNNNLVIKNSTSDGDDYRFIQLCGGGDQGVTRGGYITLHGNESSTDPGCVVVNCGNGNGYVEGNIQLNGTVILNDSQLLRDGGSLDIRADGNIAIYADADDQTIGLYGATTQVSTTNFVVDGAARFSVIGSGTSAGALHYTSDGTLTTSTSDIRMKHDIEPLSDYTLQKIMDLNPVNFKWNGTNKESIGLIAQEVAEILPELTFTNPIDGYMGIHYSELSAVLVKGIQQLKINYDSKIKELEDKISLIEKRFDYL